MEAQLSSTEVRANPAGRPRGDLAAIAATTAAAFLGQHRGGRRGYRAGAARRQPHPDRAGRSRTARRAHRRYLHHLLPRAQHPALIAGVATAHVGLHRTALAYCAAIAALVAVAAGTLILRRRGPATGQGTSYQRPGSTAAIAYGGTGRPAAPAGWFAAGPPAPGRHHGADPGYQPTAEAFLPAVAAVHAAARGQQGSLPPPADHESSPHLSRGIPQSRHPAG